MRQEEAMEWEEARFQFIKLQEQLTRCQKDKEQQQQTIKELAEALDNAADAFTWFNKHDFAATYRSLAAQHLKDK